MTSPSTTACVIGDRYLASAAVVRAHPLGPVEALDTQSGRAAQVRIVFVPGSWQEEELAEAVSRWCGLGCAEVCGVLDFGRHDDRWYLTVPPSLGMSLERWRAVRRPSAADAARLTLGFGRLVERSPARASGPTRPTCATWRSARGRRPSSSGRCWASPAIRLRPAAGRRAPARLGASTIAPQELPADLCGLARQRPGGRLRDARPSAWTSSSAARARPPAVSRPQDGLAGLFDDDDLPELLPGRGVGRGAGAAAGRRSSCWRWSRSRWCWRCSVRARHGQPPRRCRARVASGRGRRRRLVELRPSRQSPSPVHHPRPHRHHHRKHAVAPRPEPAHHRHRHRLRRRPPRLRPRPVAQVPCQARAA